MGQLFSITHKIYKSFDASPSLKVRCIFFGISKAFYKLNLLAISSRCYNSRQSVLDSIHQRVVLNDQSSERSLVVAGVPGVYIKDLPRGLRCNAKLFAANTLFFSTITSPTIS